MKVLFADKFQENYLDDIKSLGHECVLRPGLTADDLPREIIGFNTLIVRSTRVTAETIDASDDLALIIRAGAGTNTIDKSAAAAKRIYVCNVPGKNAVAVAELAFGLLLSIDRNIPDNVIELREGRWNKKKYSTARGLLGRKVGIVGLGEIGLAFAERARAFGMEIYAVAKPGRPAHIRERINQLGVALVEDLHRLAETCDVLSFHVPAHPQTTGMINDEFLSHVRAGAVIINTSRGEIVDDDALIKAMDEKGIRVGLDVYNDEPASPTGEFSTRLSTHPNVYGTHHIGASTEQAQNAVAEAVVELLRAFQSGEVRNCVNLAVEPAGS